MKALSLTQPWAQLVALGAKKIETRSWSTKYRGPLAIHAAKGMPRAAQDLCIEQPFFDALIWNLPTNPSHRGIADRFVRGAVIATCRLVDVVPIKHNLDRSNGRPWCTVIEPGFKCEFPPYSVVARLWVGAGFPQSFGIDESSFGDYSPGRFAWVLDDVERLAEPIPAKGALGLWEWER